MPKQISAVILSFNSERYIETCLRELFRAFDELGGEHDAWVVENGSTDRSPEILRGLEEEYPNLRVIYCPENTGTTRSRNQALRASDGRHVLVLDSDATVDADCLRKLVEVLESDPAIGMAVPRLSYPDGRYQLSTDQFPTLTRKVRRFLKLKEMESSVEPPTQRCDVDYAISALWLVKREVFDEVGLLDERIFYSPEDVDFCLRTWLGGFRIVLEPSARAIHDAQELSRGTALSKFAARHASGLLYYFRKHRYLLGLGGVRRRIARARRKAVETS